jgi:putative spermidine/putrescine transport system substrate-binding protein
MTKWSASKGGLVINRRHALVAAGVGMLSAPWVWRRAEAAQVLTVRDAGGSYVEAYKEAFYDPFEKATGVKVVPAVAEHEPTAEIKAMVDTKNYTWDVALLSLGAHNLLAAGDYLAPLELEKSVADEIPAEYRRPTFLGIDVYTTVLCYRTDTVKNPPKSWADFWDVKNFPGRRAMRNYPFDTIEEALMADGVPPSKVYPCDLDRAFKKLDKIKPSINVWWKQGAQATQLLKTGEVDMITNWNGAAQRAIDAGAPAKIVWNQNIAGVEGWSILRGTPRTDIARKFVAFCADPKQQSIFTKYMTYGPTNPNAFKYIDPARAALLSTNPEYRKTALLIDSDYWATHKDQAVERFDAWMLG